MCVLATRPSDGVQSGDVSDMSQFPSARLDRGPACATRLGTGWPMKPSTNSAASMSSVHTEPGVDAQVVAQRHQFFGGDVARGPGGER